MGRVIGGVLGGVLGTAAKPVAPLKPAPLRVGGCVRPQGPLFNRLRNIRPRPGRLAFNQGQVQLDAVFDDQGKVIEMKVVSGPPLLHRAAMGALKKWKGEPPLLK